MTGIRDRVLVIDDDPDLRDLVTVMLSDWALEAVPAATCKEALTLLERERGRLRAVLLDYYMPDLDACERARVITARVEPEVPVVLMSATVDIAARAREVGLARFLAKPFEPEALRAALALAPP